MYDIEWTTAQHPFVWLHWELHALEILEHLKHRVKDKFGINKKQAKMKVCSGWHNLFVTFSIHFFLSISPPLSFCLSLPPPSLSLYLRHTSKPMSVSELCESQCLIRFSLSPASFLSPPTFTVSHLPSSFCHKSQADLARTPTFPTQLPQIPYFPPPLLVSSLSKDSNPPSSLLCCLDLKHKQVSLYWLIKGRKHGEGGGLICAQARRHICLLCLCLPLPSCGFPCIRSIIFDERRGYWVEMHGKLSALWHSSNPVSVLSFALFVFLLSPSSITFLPPCSSFPSPGLQFAIISIFSSSKKGPPPFIFVWRK